MPTHIDSQLRETSLHAEAQPQANQALQRKGGELQYLLLDAIRIVHNPRKYFDDSELEQLAASIKAQGVLETLVVRPAADKDGTYELVAGERRYRAAKMAGLEEVPVTVRDFTDEKALEIAMQENLLRQDLNPVEETEAILQILSSRLEMPKDEVTSWLYRMKNDKSRKTYNVITQPEAIAIEQVFKELAVLEWESFIANRLPLLKLPGDILEALRAGRIEYTKAKTISRVKDEQRRSVLLDEAIEQGLSLRQIRERMAQINQSPTTQPTQEIQDISRRLKKSRLWETDPKRWKRVLGYMQKIGMILEES